MAEQMGAGAALLDYDNDGDLDVFLVQGGPLAPGSVRSGLSTSRLFRNDLKAGRLRFTDVTDRAGVGLRAYGMGTAVGDYDGDGDLDLFVTSFGPETLYRNNGDGTFTDVTEAGRRQRRRVEHERHVRRLRSRRAPRPVRGELRRLHGGRQPDLPRFGRRARLLQPARLSSGRRIASTGTWATDGSPT